VDGEWTTMGNDRDEPFLVYDNGAAANVRVTVFGTESDHYV